MSNSSILPTVWTPLGAATLGQTEPGSNGSDGVLLIPQGSSITGASPSDCQVSYLGHSLEDLNPLQRCSLYFAASADRDYC